MSSPSWSETVSKDDLVWRDLLFYKKFTDVPFTGKVTGQWSGTIKNGKKEGIWTAYHENGQLFVKGTYKDGKSEGIWKYYRDDGQVWHQRKYKDGKKEGCWEYFFKDGSNYTSLFKNDKRQGDCP